MLITNHYLCKIGELNKFGKLIFMENPDPKKFIPPDSSQTLDTIDNLSSTGKHHADCIESLIGSTFLSNGLPAALKFMDDISLLPLSHLHLLPHSKPRHLYEFSTEKLPLYNFTINDSIS